MKKENAMTMSGEASGMKTEKVPVWTRIQKFFNGLPLGITECRSIKDAKYYTAVMLLVLSALFLPLLIPAIWVFSEAKKEE